MAKEKKQYRANLDWYLVSIDQIRKIAAVVVLVLLGVGGWFFYKHQTEDPKLRAERAISDAESSLNTLASSKEFNNYRTDFDRAKTKLDEAKSLIGQEKFPDAENAAIESQTISTTATGRQTGPKESDAQFLSFEGDVQFQKASNSDWKKADSRAPLFNGDWVKTGDSSSAELIFSNGSLYTVGPNALLEIYAMVTPGSTKKQGTVQMQVGSVEINTSDDISTVKTPSTQVVIKSESTAQVGVDANQKSTQVVSLKGSASVQSTTGGSAVELASGETVKATKEGTLSAKKTFLPPPALLAPADNQLFRGSADSRVQFGWDKVPSAAGYQLQVSRSRLFAGLEINANRPTNSAGARVTSEGSYYWRVASIDPNGEVGPFSTFRRFRVSGVGSISQSASSDHTAPTLQIERPFRIGGGNYIIKGRVEAGSTVFLNDTEVDVDSDGSFQKLVTLPRGVNNVVLKAVDAAGNENVQNEKIVVQEDE